MGCDVSDATSYLPGGVALTLQLREDREALWGPGNPGPGSAPVPTPRPVSSPSLPQYQGFRVQLKSVKKLSDLEGQWAPSPRLQAQSPQPSVCHHSALPPDLQPICQSEEAASIFQALSECPAPAEALASHSLSSPHASSSTHVASAKPPG